MMCRKYSWLAVLIFPIVLLSGCSALTGNAAALQKLNGMGGSETSEPLTADMILDTLEEPKEELFYSVYQVKKGDMIGMIAEKYGITQDTLISLNKIKQTRYIQIGQFLKIPSMSGILYTTKKNNETPATIAGQYNISAEKIIAVNRLPSQNSLTAGMQLFLPDAELDWVTRQEINGDLFRKPLRNSYYQSSSFGWRSSPFTGQRTYHNGIDMAAAYGTEVKAALSGKVIAAGFDTTYGNYIIVSHHSGYKTLYGHMSAFVKRGIVYKNAPSAGWQITTGETIGKVGTTGMSTGPHLHFTIFRNNIAINPVNLWN